ncbi:TonB C-terminal domain-containing protein [Azospirillum brasilense]|uniref:TonB C-terminal domain-containing protein n=1 Tax=Azospirillum brasilense TaxID=192 RepID=UPI001FFF9082|nr:TonB C-terminal domain-containing protein [Azospirillum brasilense]
MACPGGRAPPPGGGPPPRKSPPPPPPPPTPKPPKPEPPKPEPPKPEPKKPEPPKPEPAKPEPPKPEPKKPEPAKPEPPKAEPKKPEKPPEKTDALADLLKNVQKNAPAKPAASESKADAKPTQHAAASPAPSGAAKAVNGPDKPFKPSGRAIDGIRGAVGKNWNFDPGRKDAGNMQVELRVELSRDGTVLNVTADPKYEARYRSDAAFRASVDAAIRAIRKTSPLPIGEFSGDFTPARYEEWRYFVFNFDPRDMF